MRIPRIFIDQSLTANTEIELPAETSHYLQRVLRLPANAPLKAFNGKGGQYQATITGHQKHSTTIQLGEFTSENLNSPLDIHLGICISRGERMDLVIQKATELGVTAITPLFSERCEVKLKGERLEKKCAHWRKVSVSACEQSGLNLLPEIHPPVDLNLWLESTTAELKLVLHPAAEKKFESEQQPRSVALLIGAEGGLTDTEIDQAAGAEFTPLHLGRRVLRTETAPIVALSILQYRWGDLAG